MRAVSESDGPTADRGTRDVVEVRAMRRAHPRTAAPVLVLGGGMLVAVPSDDLPTEYSDLFGS